MPWQNVEQKSQIKICQGKVREKRKFFKVREKSGNFLRSQGKSLILSKSVKSQGILFSGLLFISFLQGFEMHFLSEKMKSMLQSKQSDQCNTLRLIHVVVVVSGFRCEWFLPNSFFLFAREKREKFENEEKNVDGRQKRTKQMETSIVSH